MITKDGWKIKNSVMIDGKKYDFDVLPPEEQKRIGIIINENALRAAGYVRKQDDKTA